MKFKHFETESGETLSKAQFDANLIDNILEGLMVSIEIKEDGNLQASVDTEEISLYTGIENFDIEVFLKKAVTYAEGLLDFTTVTGEECFLVKDKVIGEFKPKRKFINFVQGRKGGIRSLSNTALLEGKKLSGLLEDTYFKVTICDEDTINFEEVDTNISNKEMIQRFIDEIDSTDVTGYMEKYIVSGINFVDSKGNVVYLEVEEKRPIEKLFSLFDEIKKPEISKNGLSILNSLFGESKNESSDLEVEVEEETVETETKPLSYAQQMVMESFQNTKREKIEEIQSRIESKEKEINRLKMTKRSTENSIENSRKDLRVLNTRLEDMKPKSEPNGIIFYVSPENKSEIDTDDDVKRVVKKISEALKLKEDIVLGLVTDSYFEIKFTKKNDITSSDSFIMDNENLERFTNKFAAFGKLTRVGKDFQFSGDLNWHQIVDKLINMGFEQEPEWDKICGSPSYESEFDSEKLHKGEISNVNHKRDSNQIDDSKFYYEVILSLEENLKKSKFETYEECVDVVNDYFKTVIEFKNGEAYYSQENRKIDAEDVLNYETYKGRISKFDIDIVSASINPVERQTNLSKDEKQMSKAIDGFFSSMGLDWKI